MRDGGRIIVAGAGIGGLTVAVALSRQGFPVTLLEQAERFAPLGAGLSLGPSATKVLDALGLGDRLRRDADVPARQAVIDHLTLEPIVEGMDGYSAAGSDGRSLFHQIHRADFHEILEQAARASGVEIRLGAKVVGYSQKEGVAEALLDDGSRVEGALLVGADGVRSALRKQMQPGSDAVFTGQVAFRCVIPTERVATLIDGYGSATIMGPGAIFTRYLIRKGTLLNCVGIVRTDAWTQEGWSHPATRAEFQSFFQGWHPSIASLIEAAPEEHLIKWALYDHSPTGPWHDGRVVLLGDAAHPMLPFLGQGAGMAIEDAMILARALSEAADTDAALDTYEFTRKPRAVQTHGRSREQGKLYQAKSAEEYRASPRPAADTQFFGYDPTTAKLEGAMQ